MPFEEVVKTFIGTWGIAGALLIVAGGVIKYLFGQLMISLQRQIDLIDKYGGALNKTAEALEENNRQAAAQATRWEVLLAMMKTNGLPK